MKSEVEQIEANDITEIDCEEVPFQNQLDIREEAGKVAHNKLIWAAPDTDNQQHRDVLTGAFLKICKVKPDESVFFLQDYMDVARELYKSVKCTMVLHTSIAEELVPKIHGCDNL